MLGSKDDDEEVIKLKIDKDQKIRHIYQKKESSLDLYLNGIKLTNDKDEEIGKAEWGTGTWVGPFEIPDGWPLSDGLTQNWIGSSTIDSNHFANKLDFPLSKLKLLNPKPQSKTSSGVKSRG